METEIIQNIIKKALLKNAGVNTLEASLCFLLIFFVLLISTATWEVVNASGRLAGFAERIAYAFKGPVFSYNNNHGNLESDFNQIMDLYKKIIPEELKRLSDEINSVEQFRIDIAFASLAVDSIDGRPGNITKIDYLSSGTWNLPDFLTDGNEENGEADIKRALVEYIRGSADSIAIPAYSLGVQGSELKYLPEVPLIAVRVVADYSNHKFLRSTGILSHSCLWDIKIAHFRGGV